MKSHLIAKTGVDPSDDVCRPDTSPLPLRRLDLTDELIGAFTVEGPVWFPPTG